MTTSTLKRKLATSFFATRFALVAGILIFSLSIGKAQNLPGSSDYKQTTKTADEEKAQSGVTTKTQLPILSNTKPIISNKLGEHGPAFGDPDYEAKKIEWMNNYPEEYKAFGGVTGSEVESSAVVTHSSAKPHTKIAEHAPYLDDPNYAAEKAEWRKKYPEEYNTALKESSNTTDGQSPTTLPEINKPATKVAEHAPLLNDPDYATKKAEWIQNYPEEYNALMNNSSNDNKNVPATPAVKQTATKVAGQNPTMSVPDSDATKK